MSHIHVLITDMVLFCNFSEFIFFQENSNIDETHKSSIGFIGMTHRIFHRLNDLVLGMGNGF